MKVFFDTSVLVASCVRAHPHHARAISVVREAARGGDHGHVAGHGLSETYAVLTTLPVTPRIGPEAAHRMIADNILECFTVVALTSREHGHLIGSLSESGIVGGATYDAVHAACARKADVDRLYTFNVSHFRRVAPDLVDRVVAP